MKALYPILIAVTFYCSLVGCDKHHAKKLAGTYQCEVNSSSWMMGSPTSDTTYFVDLIVERNGKNVIVLNSAIHIDSLWEGKEYTTGSGSNYSSIQFIGDSLYIHYNSGGLGGGSYGTYKGKKKKS